MTLNEEFVKALKTDWTNRAEVGALADAGLSAAQEPGSAGASVVGYCGRDGTRHRTKKEGGVWVEIT